MPTPEDAESKAKADKLKAELDKLREDWDRYDNMGSQSDRANYISREIDFVKAKLKKLTGEDY